MRFKRFVVAAMFGLVAAAPQIATATVLSIDTAARGWINSDGISNASSGPNNYLAGNCGALSCSFSGEYRNFFTFSIPVLSEDVLGAALRLDSRMVKTDQAASFIYQVTSTTGLTFAALGTGQLFGERAYTSGDAFAVRDITLDGDALAAIAAAGGGTLTISGRVLPPTQFGGEYPGEFAFGDSIGRSTRLILTTGAAVPEPMTWALMILGLGGVGTMLRRQRASAIA